VPRPLVLPVIGLGISFGVTAYGYIGSVAYIPVSLAAVIMYTYPLMVAVLSRIVNRELFTLVKAAAALTAFAGIAVMLGFSFSGLDWRGIALAFLGATGYTVCIIGSSRMLRRVSFLTLTFHFSAVSALPFLAVGAMSGGFVAPVSTWGWVGTAGVGVTFLFGFLAFLAGVKLIGATRTAVICNLEPIVSVLCGFALFAESFTATQGFGAAVILASVFLLVYEDARIRRRAAAPAA
jgi:drug/metabolite transporter (DMT)-like permease